jgi:hypothetical protein
MSDERLWRVVRQDDNGNRFVIAEVESLVDAERLVRQFETLGHKQTYWVEPLPVSTET